MKDQSVPNIIIDLFHSCNANKDQKKDLNIERHNNEIILILNTIKDSPVSGE
jgi:hypothetical protein